MGSSRLMLLLPTKSWARPMMVDMRDISPWWYAECSATEPASWATLISRLSLRLKHVYSTLRCPGLSPSTRDGIERSLSMLLNRISSLLTKSS
uniref:Uncharacterized protein n=1 Tax=Ixodes ricinus TaxID=34613 RepID=A0A6B0UHB5_IXORI